MIRCVAEEPCKRPQREQLGREKTQFGGRREQLRDLFPQPTRGTERAQVKDMARKARYKAP